MKILASSIAFKWDYLYAWVKHGLKCFAGLGLSRVPWPVTGFATRPTLLLLKPAGVLPLPSKRAGSTQTCVLNMSTNGPGSRSLRGCRLLQLLAEAVGAGLALAQRDVTLCRIYLALRSLPLYGEPGGVFDCYILACMNQACIEMSVPTGCIKYSAVI